jgi:hypothetical protein
MKKSIVNKYGNVKKKILKTLYFGNYDSIVPYENGYICMKKYFKTYKHAENYRKASLYDGFM